MPEGPTYLLEGGGPSQILTNVEQAMASEEEMQAILRMGHGLEARRRALPPVQRLTWGLALAVGVAVATTVAGATRTIATPARRTTARHIRDWRWTFQDFTSGLVPFLQEFDASWAKLIERVLDPQTDGSLPNVEARHVTLRNSLYEDRPGRTAGWIWRLGTAVQSVSEAAREATEAVGRRVTALRTETLGYVESLDQSIATLRRTLLDPDTGLIARLSAQIAGVQTEVGTLVRGRIVPLEQTATRHEESIGGLAAWVGPVAGALPVATAVALAPTLIENEPKLRSQCVWDLDSWGQIMDALLYLVGFGVIFALYEDVAGVIGDVLALAFRPVTGAWPDPYEPPPAFN